MTHICAFCDEPLTLEREVDGVWWVKVCHVCGVINEVLPDGASRGQGELPLETSE